MIKMTRRVTLLIDEETYKKLRQIQSKQILKTNSSVSYSQIINEILKKSLK